jgi:uncharacterized protein
VALSKFDQAAAYAIFVLQHDLLPAFLYHNANHTIEDMVPACQKLAEMEGIAMAQRQLLGTAAYFHDLGFTAITSTEPQTAAAGRAKHEEKSVEMARTVLPGFGFDTAEIDLICRLILATKWGRQPQDILEEILCDADMSSIGGDVAYYHKTSDALRQEMALFGTQLTDAEWLERQIKTLASYNFHTAAARALYDANRLTNIRDNQRLLANIG